MLESSTHVWAGPSVDLLRLHENNPARYPFLLESAGGEISAINRYSLLLAFPEHSLTLNHDGLFDGSQQLDETDFLQRLDRQWHQHWLSSERLNPEQPFNGGWFVYLGYELAEQIEPSLKLPRAESTLPIALAVRCPAAVVIDHQLNQLSVFAEPDHQDAANMLAQMLDDLKLASEQDIESSSPSVERVSEDPDANFVNSVARIQEYLLNGDVFQVNLSRKWVVQCIEQPSAAGLYRNLRRANPAPFAGLFNWHKHAVISSSPERLVQVRGRDVQTRPIAGTRPRKDFDEAERNALIGHPKERAEHIMLIDLERNDLGRVCEPGSVQVDELLGLESYAHVHHIVSNVRGRLRDTASPLDALRAVFPGGTITGCPKVRCMQIIAELEAEGRGPYTGAMGYLDRGGNMDMNILIRSLELQDKNIIFRAGAGIVADSVAGDELQETRAKAAGLLKSLGLSDA
ncbi:MAG: aminodeoxychorismate synthase component I [Nevskiales bacterium]